MWERGLVRDVPFEGVLEWEPDGEIKTSRDQCDTAPKAPFSDRSVGLEGDVFVPRRLRAALAGSERLGRAHRAAATRAPRPARAAGRGNGERGWAGPERRTGALLSPAARVVWAPRTAPPHVLSTCAHSGFRRRRLPGPRAVPPLLGCGECAPSD